jgi:mannosyltransferase
MNWRRAGALILLMLLAFALRVCRLDNQELRGDEAFGVLFATRSARQIVSETISAAEPHPPLDYLLLRGWMGVAGDSELAVRFPSAAAGLLAVPLAFALGCRIFGQTAGIGAAFFLAINPFHVWHAQEARMYTISAALALATTLVLWIALGKGGWQRWLGFALLTAAHFYLHYYSFFIALGQGLWVLAVARHDRRRLAEFSASVLAVGLLYLPWLVLAWRVILAYHGNGDSPSLPDMLLRCLRAFSLGQTNQLAIAAVFLPAFAGLGAIGAWCAARRQRAGALLLALWLVVPLAGVWIASLRRPVFDERYVIAATPPFYLFLGTGAACLVRQGPWRRRLLGLLVAVCVAGSALSLWNYYVAPEYSKSAGWRQVVDYLDGHAQSGEVLIQNYPDPSLAYYYRGPLERLVLPHRSGVPPEQTIETLEALLDGHDRLWFLPYPDTAWDANGLVWKWLERHTDLSQDVVLGHVRLQAYLPLRVSLEQMTAVEALLGDVIRLRGYRLAGTAEPGGTLALTLYWQALAPASADYVVFAHLVGANGAIVGQKDQPPQNGATPTTTWIEGEVLADHYLIPVRADAPAGPAQLLVGMYVPETMTRLAAVGSTVDSLERIHLIDLEIHPQP